MQLPPGGLDVFYIDESGDRAITVMSAVSVPFLRLVEDNWTLVWEDHLSSLLDWRRRLSKSHGIPVRKELKGNMLLSGRGRYAHGKHQFTRTQGEAAYRAALSDLGFLQRLSVITATGTSQSNLYGHSRLEAVLYALLQRMRTACIKARRVGMVFFDEGHGEYRKLYRKAKVYLPTGSSMGGWGGGGFSKNLPLTNFVKDGNIQQSHHAPFIQLADMVSFACLLKIRGERGVLPAWQNMIGAGTLYDAIPRNSLNTFASAADPLGIVRLP